MQRPPIATTIWIALLMAVPLLAHHAISAEFDTSNPNKLSGTVVTWIGWFSAPTFTTYREGRFIVVELSTSHRVLTTSSCVGGVSSAIRHLVNHQSCEANGHSER